MAVRSARLGQTNTAGGGAGAQVNLYTGGTDTTTIVKELRVSLGAGAAPPYTVAWEVSHSGGAFRKYAEAVLTAVGKVVAEECWFCLKETDVLRVNVPAGATAFCVANGAVLDGDPPV